MMQLIVPETTLETSRLFLEPLVESHARLIYKQLQDERLYLFIPQEPPISMQVLETRYHTLSTRLSPDRQKVWLNWVVRRKEGTYIGTLEATVYPNQTGAIAYLIFPSFWRQRYAKEGCSPVINHLFKNYKVKVIAAEIDTRNIASIQLIESLGFKCVSRQENADFFKGCASHEYRYECVSSLTSHNVTVK